MLKIETLERDEERVGTIPQDVEANLRRREAEAIYGSSDDIDGFSDGDSWEDFFAQSESYTITKLTPGVRDQNRVNVFLDGHFAFSLDVTQVIDFDVKVGQKVDAERLKTLQGASEFGKLYQRTLEWVLTRPHSIRETEDYLRRRKLKRSQLNWQREKEGKRPIADLQDDTIVLVVQRLIEKGYLDDLKFAKFFVENRFIRKGVSQKRLKMELKRKGVKDEYITTALAAVSRPEDDEMRKMIKKKRAKYNDFQLVGYLVRQGFNFQKAKDVVENYQPDEDI